MGLKRGGPARTCADESAEPAGGARAELSIDTTAQGASGSGFPAIRRRWAEQMGPGFPLPQFTPETTSALRVKTRAARVGDAVVIELGSQSALRAPGTVAGAEVRAGFCVVEQGAWTIATPAGDARTVGPGQFLFSQGRWPALLRAAPCTRATVVVVPAPAVAPLLRDRIVAGRSDEAEVRLLAAHARMIQATVGQLGPAGLAAARSTLIELAASLARGSFDDTESALASVLARAGKELAESRLADPGLSLAMLARELTVSVRTLQRAFAATGTGEPVTAYIRRRRLEEARRALSAPVGRPTVSEVAARWQFADSSHFSRAFKKQYGCSPGDYARMRPGDQSLI